jgi:hypothetical protein
VAQQLQDKGARAGAPAPSMLPDILLPAAHL